jgi:hypothetical protein
MFPGHTSFKVEIKKLKFETDEGMMFPLIFQMRSLKERSFLWKVLLVSS